MKFVSWCEESFIWNAANKCERKIWYFNKKINLINGISSTRKVFLPVILNIIQIFTGIKQWRIKTNLKILVAEFKRDSSKFILNNCAGSTEMPLYRLLANLKTWNSITSFLWWLILYEHKHLIKTLDYLCDVNDSVHQQQIIKLIFFIKYIYICMYILDIPIK